MVCKRQIDIYRLTEKHRYVITHLLAGAPSQLGAEPRKALPWSYSQTRLHNRISKYGAYTRHRKNPRVNN